MQRVTIAKNARPPQNSVLERIPGVTLYYQLYLVLKTQAKRSKAKLPSERVLMCKFGVSRNTVRTAAAMLESEGCISSLRGSGRYPLHSPVKRAARG